jgi:hypothetical protein
MRARGFLLCACALAASCASEPRVDPSPPAQAPFDQAFVVELAPGQPAEDIRSAAAALFGRVVSIEPVFPDVSPSDDPFHLGRIYRTRVAGPGPEGNAWDDAYTLNERGRFVRVEPDSSDTLADESKRQMSILCRDDSTAPTDPSWSLREMRVPEARGLQPPAGGKPLGEGVRICHPDTGWTDHVDLDRGQLDLASALNLIEGGTDARDPLGYVGNPGHGTATGSVIVSSGGFGASNGTTPPGAIDGVAPRATVVPIRAVKSVVQVFDSDVARAVNHATIARCDVISMSLGGRFFFGLERAIDDATSRGVIVVAAAGNCVGFVVAPAGYAQSVAVAATNVHHQPWSGTSKGRAVDIAAPGEDVYVAEAAVGSGPHQATHTGNGTSFATAAVAGSAADWLAFYGSDAIERARHGRTRRDVFVAALRASATKPNGWDGATMGAGIVNLDGLLRSDPSAPER